MSKDRTKAIPTGFESVALIDGPTCAAIGQMSLTWWLDKVRSGEAPKPALQGLRCTRWRAKDVQKFWQATAAKGTDDSAAVLMAAVAKAAQARATRGPRVKRRPSARA